MQYLNLYFYRGIVFKNEIICLSLIFCTAHILYTDYHHLKIFWEKYIFFFSSHCRFWVIKSSYTNVLKLFLKKFLKHIIGIRSIPVTPRQKVKCVRTILLLVIRSFPSFSLVDSDYRRILLVEKMQNGGIVRGDFNERKPQ